MLRSALIVSGVMAILTTSPVYALGDVVDCADKTEDIFAAADVIVRNWDDWEEFVEAQTSVNIKNCMKNRFEKNGIVMCESTSTGKCSKAAAWSNPLNKKIHLCPSTLSIL